MLAFVELTFTDHLGKPVVVECGLRGLDMAHIHSKADTLAELISARCGLTFGYDADKGNRLALIGYGLKRTGWGRKPCKRCMFDVAGAEILYGGDPLNLYVVTLSDDGAAGRIRLKTPSYQLLSVAPDAVYSRDAMIQNMI